MMTMHIRTAWMVLDLLAEGWSYRVALARQAVPERSLEGVTPLMPDRHRIMVHPTSPI